MENIAQLQKLIEKATSSSEGCPQDVYDSILAIINSRVDMPKHAIAAISKRMVLKNKNVLINIFTLLEYLSYTCELSLYTQISTKQFLFKISGLLMNKDIDSSVKNKIMQTIYCWEELFRPHQDLLPLFFTFYAGLLRNNFDIPHGYKSKFRPAQLKQYKKIETLSSAQNPSKRQKRQKKYIPQPTLTEQQVFQQIREKLILTNEIIDNASPSDSVKENALLIEMIQQIKGCQKKVNETINTNPSQKIMELALASNDDIFITYRRFKDLQRNKKPQPFILTQLASDIIKQTNSKKIAHKQNRRPEEKREQPPQKKEQTMNILDFEAQSKPVPPPQKKQQNILDLDFQQAPKPTLPQQKRPPQGDIFDLLGQVQNGNNQQQQKKSSYDDMFNSLSLGDNNQGNQMQTNYISQPQQNNNLYTGINLNSDDFTTDADIKSKQNNMMMQKLGDFSDFLKKSK